MKNNNFILVHNDNDNSPIAIDLNNIILIDSATSDHSNNRCTKIYLYSRDINPFKIAETPEKIYDSILKSKKSSSFVRLHNENDNSPIMVNMDFTILVDFCTFDKKQQTPGSKIYISGNVINPFKVNETPERVYTMYENNLINYNKN